VGTAKSLITNGSMTFFGDLIGFEADI
jgi:hypothetical protein